jgi:UDP-N-acetylmuramoylalanine--D-glutamate ligase
MELVRKILLQRSEPIAIFGNGASAEGIQKLCQRFDLRFVIYDQNPEKGEAFTGKSVGNHRVVVGSPSFLPNHPWVIQARQNRLLFLSELDFAGLWCEAPMVAITGTNGKTTITAFLEEVFNRHGIRAFYAGNIGRPLSELVAMEDLKPDDLIFCETSSFQAESLQFVRFAHLIWSNVAVNHLDIHGTMRKYFLAKYNLLSHLDGNSQIICGESVLEWAHKFQVAIPERAIIVRPECDTKGTAFEDYPQWENFALIKKFCAFYHIPPETVLAAAKNFQKPKYRLENIGEIRGNNYWNDSKCTNFAALDSALKNFPKEAVIWIGGGRSKGENLADLVPIVREKVETALLIGEEGIPVVNLLQGYGMDAVYVKWIANAINWIKNACIANKNILFSPAFSSLDQFSDYAERGESFEKCIFDLKFRYRWTHSYRKE